MLQCFFVARTNLFWTPDLCSWLGNRFLFLCLNFFLQIYQITCSGVVRWQLPLPTFQRSAKIIIEKCTKNGWIYLFAPPPVCKFSSFTLPLILSGHAADNMVQFRQFLCKICTNFYLNLTLQWTLCLTLRLSAKSLSALRLEHGVYHSSETFENNRNFRDFVHRSC